MRPKVLMRRRSPAATASSLYHESLRGETCGGFLRLGKMCCVSADIGMIDFGAHCYRTLLN